MLLDAWCPERAALGTGADRQPVILDRELHPILRAAVDYLADWVNTACLCHVVLVLRVIEGALYLGDMHCHTARVQSTNGCGGEQGGEDHVVAQGYDLGARKIGHAQ